MEIGFIGVGRMGKAMARNLIKAGHRVRAWDKSPAALQCARSADGAAIATGRGRRVSRRRRDLHAAQ